MARHDEGAANIAVFHKTFAVGHAQSIGQLHRARAARFRNRDDDIDLVERDALGDFACQRLAHVHARLVDRNAVHGRIGARQINVFKNARRELRARRTLLLVHAATIFYQHGFAGGNVALKSEEIAF